MITAYFDCFSGISGDMTLGALVSLGLPVQWLKQQISGLPLTGFDISSENVMCNGIGAVRVHVSVHGETHHHRDYQTIRALLQDSPYSERVKQISLRMFERIAEAEAKIHGCDKDKVHFHEVGSVDAIVDIVGTCLGMEYLGIEKVTASPLPLGSGFVTCRHGVLPVPAPATLEILKGVPVCGGQEKKELTTPTGAAIITSLAQRFETMPSILVDRIGYGAGSHKLEKQPNLLRVMVGKEPEHFRQEPAETLVMIETAIDNMNPEFFGFLMDKLFQDGALDVFWIPVHMKKNRPGTLINVLCRPREKEILVHRIFSETTTLGVRHHDVCRTALSRRMIEIDTPFGKTAVKEVIGHDGTARIVPEFDRCRQIAEARSLPLQQVYDTIIKSAYCQDNSKLSDQPSKD